MSAHDKERLGEMLVALLPLLMGFAALLMTSLAIWRFHELRLRRMRATGTAGSEPKFVEGIICFGLPVGVLFVPFRGLSRRSDVLDRIPVWIQMGAGVGALVAYPAMIFAYVMAAHRMNVPLDGAKFRFVPSGLLIVSLSISLVAARVLGWH